MRALRLLLASSLIALSLIASPACATSYSTDQSDLWYIPAESGWGIQLVQRGNIIFFTMFVYDAAHNPVWYVGTLNHQGSGYVWTGDMYLTTGPWFGATFNPALFGGRIVGSMTWNGITVTTGTLTYSVDGVAVVKNVVRQTLVNEDYSGRYGGGLHEDRSGCFSSIFNGTYEDAAILVVSQTGTAVTMSTQTLTGGVCSYSGTLTQDGQMGTIAGAYSCSSDGDHGNFTLFEVQITRWAISGRLDAASVPTGCHGTGWFGGARTTTF